MIVERITTPSASPVSLSEVKAHLRIEHSMDDARLDGMIWAATREVEDTGQLALLSQTIRVTLPVWPGGLELQLPIGPVLSGAATVTIDGEAYTDHDLTTGKRPTLRVGVASNALTSAEAQGRWVIEYSAGWVSVSDIPQDLKHAVMDAVMWQYDGCDGQSLAMWRAVSRYRGVRA